MLVLLDTSLPLFLFSITGFNLETANKETVECFGNEAKLDICFQFILRVG